MIKTKLVTHSDNTDQASLQQDRLRMLSQNKDELEQMIEAKKRHGWQIVSRSYSMDDGHGAEMVRADLNKAA